MPTRRSLLRLAAAAVLPALAGCNLRPIHAGPRGGEVNSRLAAVEVEEIGGRLGYLVRNYLLDDLNPAGLSVAPLYTLEVRLDREQDALAIQLDDRVTRYNLFVAASFDLKRKADAQTLYRSAVRRVASYNVRGEPFATLVAEQDAERRAAREVARQIRTMLSLYLTERVA